MEKFDDKQTNELSFLAELPSLDIEETVCAIANNYVNYIKTTTGKVSAICQFCGGKSKAVNPGEDGEPYDLYLAVGWSVAPFPADFMHDDGSSGSNYTCPACNNKLKAGQSLRLRAYNV